jgi:hypothetical protein
MTIALKSIVSCDILGLTKSFQSNCFSHAFSKAYQYALVDEIFCKGLKYVFVKIAQFDFKNYIIRLKKSRKGKQEWNRACVDSNVPQRKLNTQVKTRLSSKL